MEITKTDIFLAKSSVRKSGSGTFTIDLSKEKAEKIKPLLIKEGLTYVGLGTTKNLKKVALKFTAKESGVVRNAIRKLKNSGPSIYKDGIPKYVRTASSSVKKAALALKVSIPVVEAEKEKKADSKAKK